ncbi:hypothetical protein SAMN05444285_12235 [Draconibacterium orientale]|uniref:Uncharacterized protein n=1 Tax=Draconibacterium orientale TaxID=1168034 RepID=A0A1I0GYX3_9BACT|nr:hypothetical protein SAMN05444285_12235 [Draconibacterium orientale]
MTLLSDSLTPSEAITILAADCFSFFESCRLRVKNKMTESHIYFSPMQRIG